MMPQTHPYAAYRQTHVQTSDPLNLVIMLYDGAITFIQKAQFRLQQKDMEGTHQYIIRARQVVSELLSTLKPEKAGELGENLKLLYQYAYRKLLEANLRKDPALLGEVLDILTVLREGWMDIRQKEKSAQNPRGFEFRL